MTLGSAFGPVFPAALSLRVKSRLKVRNKDTFGKVDDKVATAIKGVDQLQMEKVAQIKLEKALHDEEIFWHEKYRLNWHLHGNQNTKFFHKMTQIRNVTKQIDLLKNGDSVLTDSAAIERHIVEYYEKLFSGDNDCFDNGLIVEVIVPPVSNEDNLMLTNTSSIGEIKEAVFALNSYGTPGPDGFSAMFFQEYWDIVASDVINAVLQFFTQGWLMPNFNSNIVVLIPKVSGADRIELFRPIALANFKFKIITKIHADRLTKIAPKTISEHQRDFIHGQSIGDCICLTSEAINMLDKKSFGCNLAIKIDIIQWIATFCLKSFQFLASFLSSASGLMLSCRKYI